jgi:O-antigen/teichoic acid export membrane protein
MSSGSTAGVLRNTTVLAGARIIERVGNLVIAFLISREAGVAALGTYATATAYFQLIKAAGEAGSTNLLIREMSRNRAGTNGYLVHGCAMAAVISAVVTVGAWTIIPHLGYSHELRTGLLVIVAAILPGTLNTVQEAVFVAYQRVEFETLTTLVGTLVTVVVAWRLLASGHGVVSVIVTTVIVEYVVTIVYFRLIHRRISPIRWEFDRREARQLFRELRPFAGSSLLGAAFARPEVVLLSLIGTEVQVGYYTAALKIVDLWQFVPQVFMINVFPVLSRSFTARDGEAQRVSDRSLLLLLGLALPVTAGLAITAEPLVRLLYGPGFDSAVLVLRLLAVNAVLYSLHSVWWRVLAARGEQRRVLNVQVVTLVVRLALGIGLIIAFGATGAAVSVILSLVLHVALLGRAVRFGGMRIGIGARGWRFAAAAVAMGAALVPVIPHLPLVGVIALAAAFYGGSVVALRAVSVDEIRAARSSLDSWRRSR